MGLGGAPLADAGVGPVEGDGQPEPEDQRHAAGQEHALLAAAGAGQRVALGAPLGGLHGGELHGVAAGGLLVLDVAEPADEAVALLGEARVLGRGGDLGVEGGDLGPHLVLFRLEGGALLLLVSGLVLDDVALDLGGEGVGDALRLVGVLVRGGDAHDADRAVGLGGDLGGQLGGVALVAEGGGRPAGHLVDGDVELDDLGGDPGAGAAALGGLDPQDVGRLVGAACAVRRRPVDDRHGHHHEGGDQPPVASGDGEVVGGGHRMSPLMGGTASSRSVRHW